MKLVRHGPPDHEKPGLLDSSQVVRDLSAIIPDWTPTQLSPETLAKVAKLIPADLPAVPPGTRLGQPLTGIPKFLAIGLNYTDHAREVGRTHPAEPVIFTKAISCLTGPDDDVMLPKGSTRTDWEVELGVIIGKTARYVDKSNALNFVAGYCLVNDLSEREYQNDRGGTWDKGKGCDTFGPIGPWLVTADELPDPQDLDLWLDVNGKRYQNGHTRNMIFPVAELIAWVSSYMTLFPGDLLTTGTPAGVGAGLKPPVFLKPGDTMQLGSAKLGTQQHRVTSWRQT
jgi:2,4-diketo-3-deoxy-L-fuconate hydrolase